MSTDNDSSTDQQHMRNRIWESGQGRIIIGDSALQRYTPSMILPFDRPSAIIFARKLCKLKVGGDVALLSGYLRFRGIALTKMIF